MGEHCVHLPLSQAWARCPAAPQLAQSLSVVQLVGQAGAPASFTHWSMAGQALESTLVQATHLLVFSPQTWCMASQAAQSPLLAQGMVGAPAELVGQRFGPPSPVVPPPVPVPPVDPPPVEVPPVDPPPSPWSPCAGRCCCSWHRRRRARRQSLRQRRGARLGQSWPRILSRGPARPPRAPEPGEPLHDSVCGAAVRQAGPVRIANWKTDARYRDIFKDLLAGTISELAVPSAAEEITLVLNVESPREGAFSARDERLLSAFARRTGSRLPTFSQDPRELVGRREDDQGRD